MKPALLLFALVVLPLLAACGGGDGSAANIAGVWNARMESLNRASPPAHRPRLHPVRPGRPPAQRRSPSRTSAPTPSAAASPTTPSPSSGPPAPPPPSPPPPSASRPAAPSPARRRQPRHHRHLDLPRRRQRHLGRHRVHHQHLPVAPPPYPLPRSMRAREQESIAFDLSSRPQRSEAEGPDLPAWQQLSQPAKTNRRQPCHPDRSGGT